MTLHYALQCFEGMKAYRGDDGVVRLFRPDLNAARMTSSLERLRMPTFEAVAFVECLKALLREDAGWVPTGDGHSAYLRPTAIATDPFLGVGEPSETKLFCILSPVGPYYANGFDPIAVYADSSNVRAWPGGAGNTKIGGNYAPSIKPARDAADATGGAAQQVLYLFGDDHRVTEVGAMNVFVLWETPYGTRARHRALDYGDILPGVTRRSVIELARARAPSRSPSGPSRCARSNAPRTRAACSGPGAGTAAVICPINRIFYEGDAIDVPTGADIGPVAQSFWQKLSDIHYGRVDSPWAVPVDDL
ncbi:branched-chain-amino-acid transaminase [Aureococcus anophagefferens]|nr:branched-chain-amino-acid transaminase [Aureococcus anophagefferens]